MREIIIFFCLLFGISSNLYQERLRIIDSNIKKLAAHNAYLIRGALPIKNNIFQHQKLVDNLQKLTESNFTQNFKLQVYSLLNFLTPKQTRSRYIQEKYFEMHSPGNYLNWVVVGVLIPPQFFPDWIRSLIVKIYSVFPFNMHGLIDQLHLKISQHSEPRLLILYVHCSAGVDRTGYVSGAYLMKHKNKSFQQVYRDNLQIMKGLRNHMHFNTYNGLKWFCLSLGRTDEECFIGKEQLVSSPQQKGKKEL